MAGIRTIVNGELAQGKTKGDAFKAELWRVMGPDGLTEENNESPAEMAKGA